MAVADLNIMSSSSPSEDDPQIAVESPSECAVPPVLKNVTLTGEGLPMPARRAPIARRIPVLLAQSQPGYQPGEACCNKGLL